MLFAGGKDKNCHVSMPAQEDNFQGPCERGYWGGFFLSHLPVAEAAVLVPLKAQLNLHGKGRFSAVDQLANAPLTLFRERTNTS